MKKAAVGVIFALTLLSACSTDHLSTSARAACPVNMAYEPHPAGEGTVTKLLSQSEAMTLLSKTQGVVGRTIDSAYVNNIRVIIKTDDGAKKTVLLPYGMTTEIGDRVAFQSGYLSQPPLCTYVPNLATRKL